MTEISLQSYENEIDQLIEQARYVEALVHIRHLLSQSPHYVGAYYLLGKTLLEADLPELAVDMFRRALSADPEHLLSRIGLGLAHERHNDLDGALWNLERALELDPGNAEIAEELRRTYGRRDGVEIDYVPQTRAGLARLYLRGRLYGRAAEELGALLAEQPGRPDLMTALAEAHWRNGQLVQASEVCQQILDKMPYNCKANLLLGSLWAGGGQEEGWIYLRRAQEVDPANDRASALFGTESLLEPVEVTVDRLTFDPDAIDVDQGSAWFKRLKSASISTGISEAPPEMTGAEMRLVEITAGLEAQIEIPDWLRELGLGDKEEDRAGGLGWMADVGFAEAETPAVEVSNAPVEAELPAEAEGVVTELEMAPAAATEDAGAAPEWLQELTVEAADLDFEEGEGAPAWLLELAGEQPSVPEVSPTLRLEEGTIEEVDAGAEVEVEAADWLSGLTLDEAAPRTDDTRETTLIEGLEAAESEEALPDWLAELKLSEVETETPAVALTEEEMPDWLAELEPPVAEEEVPEIALSEEEAPDWLAALESSEAQEGASEAILAAEEVPDWLAELEPSEAKAPDDAIAAEEIPEWLAALKPAEVEVTEIAPPAEETPDWLAALELSETQPVETAPAAEELPDWLHELEAEAPEALPEPGDIAAVASPVEEEGIRSGAAALTWIEGLAGGWDDETPAEKVAEAPTVVEAFEAPASVLEMPEVGEETPVVGEETVAIEEPSPLEVPELPEGDLLSGDDALAWLESLAAGKEEELRIQVERESERRVAEIMGRKVEEPAAMVESVDAGLTVIEAPERGHEAAEVVIGLEEASTVELEGAPIEVSEAVGPEGALSELQGLTAGEDLLSGEDALAWLESLSVGKEEELRLQVEQESEERVAEILGRKRMAPMEAVGEAETQVEPTMPVKDVTDLPAGDVELLPAAPEAPESVPEAWAETVSTVDSVEALPETEALSGEDALTWLEGLTPEEEEELRAQVAQEGAAVTSTAGVAAETVFGWSAFGAEPEEVASSVETAPEEAEVVPAAPEPVGVLAPEGERVPEPAVLEPESPAEPVPTIAVPEAVVAPSVPHEQAPQQVDEEPELQAPPSKPRQAAEVSAPTGTDLDEMRAYLKQKRSDHAARLSFARTLWEIGEIAESLDQYGRLIKSGAKSADVTQDLERYAEEKPDGPGVLRTLGDAYMKHGALDKALETYNRAMHQL
ncbi:MAG: tetratricopeptide repeat protein [Anaerolineae bacterium]|nr:tetratricopeptide repeat protein [Anaerolineae bacterium]